MLMMLLQIWMDYSSGRRVDATYEAEVGRSSALVGRGGGGGGVGGVVVVGGGTTPLIMCDQLTGSEPPRFFYYFFFLFKAKRIKSGSLISLSPEWRERLSDRRRPAD